MVMHSVCVANAPSQMKRRQFPLSHCVNKNMCIKSPKWHTTTRLLAQPLIVVRNSIYGWCVACFGFTVCLCDKINAPHVLELFENRYLVLVGCTKNSLSHFIEPVLVRIDFLWRMKKKVKQKPSRCGERLIYGTRFDTQLWHFALNPNLQTNKQNASAAMEKQTISFHYFLSFIHSIRLKVLLCAKYLCFDKSIYHCKSAICRTFIGLCYANESY